MKTDRKNAYHGTTANDRAAYAGDLFDRMGDTIERAHPARLYPPCAVVYNALCIYGALVAEGMDKSHARDAAAAQVIDHINSNHGTEKPRTDVH